MGCKQGNLRLIILTHGDFDHVGNANHLHERFGAKIVMHNGDSGMVERGDMFWNRRKGNILLGMIARILFGFGKRKDSALTYILMRDTNSLNMNLTQRFFIFPATQKVQ